MRRSLLLVCVDRADAEQDYRRALSRAGWAVRSAGTAADAGTLAAMRPFDVAVVHAASSARALPVVAVLRGVPVVCVVAADPTEERALLATGATVCLAADATAATAAAHARVLLALAGDLPRHRHLGDVDLDPAMRRASRAGRPVRLRPVEFDLLLLFARRAGEAVSPAEIIQTLWPDNPQAGHSLAVHLHNLRLGLERAGGPSPLNGLPDGRWMLSADPPGPCRPRSQPRHKGARPPRR